MEEIHVFCFKRVEIKITFHSTLLVSCDYAKYEEKKKF